MGKIVTIGYEGRTVEEVLELLRNAGVETLVDVRRRAHSRKKGLSKSALSLACGKQSLRYLHDARLGTPRWQLEKTRRFGYSAEDLTEFREYLLTQVEAMRQAQSAARNSDAALLCFERDHRDCHRLVVAQELATSLGAQIVHL